ncbi:ORF6 protein [Bat coronavirus BM48-31/BGR/2008]|uniref:ORF6 protein n=1 Tax=Bat coronavirus BM48-31/BGR/2008 TaxID=864596 RepID=UPI0001E13BE6|nr:ORF6 protein [Bat coronavirus BM48-31/BGR/2008]ADK66845.1 ORF6 [Bat coronavirus BM48-31/BGR/2008]
MFSLVAFQVTVAELLILIMKSFGLALTHIQIGIVSLLKILTNRLDRRYSKLDEEEPMEIDHP